MNVSMVGWDEEKGQPREGMVVRALGIRHTIYRPPRTGLLGASTQTIEFIHVILSVIMSWFIITMIVAMLVTMITSYSPVLIFLLVFLLFAGWVSLSFTIATYREYSWNFLRPPFEGIE